MKQRKRIAAVLLAAVLVLAMPMRAQAHDVPDLSRKGSVTVTVRMGETPVSGGSLTLYRVGDIAEDDGNYSFALTEAFLASGVSLDDLSAPELAETLAEYAGNTSGVTKTIAADGSAAFTELELGLYLAVQTDAAPGYSKLTPFLVSVPYMEDGAYQYDVDATVKGELERTPTPTEPTTPPDPTLPETGQLNWPIPVLATLGLILFATGWCITAKKKDA